MDLWQQATIDKIEALLRADERVKGLVLVGSFTREDVTPDIWSDIDIVIVVDNHSLEQFYPATDWISSIGKMYCFSQNSSDFNVTRACFTDTRRIDFVIVSEDSLERIEEWSYNPLCFINHCIFSRSRVLDKVLQTTFSRPVLNLIPQKQFEQMVNDFWFKGMLAVSKAGREELLVAVHLSLDMIRDCLVLGMMLRDRNTGTNHHRDGSQGNHFVEQLVHKSQPFTPQGVLESIEQCAIAFDKLAVQWDKGYEELRGTLLNWIEQTRRNMKE